MNLPPPPAPVSSAAPVRPRVAALGLMMALAAALAACGGGGSDAPAAPAAPSPPPPPASAGPYTISGKAVFESVPATPANGLNFAATVDKPVRGATVQLLSAGGTVIAATTTDTAGDYSFVLPTSQAVTVRVRAEIVRTSAATGNRDFKVLDNTAGGAIYSLDSAAFTPTANVTQNLRAASGWTVGAGYTAPRAAAPFSILDVAYDAQAKIQSAAPTLTLPSLRLFWSVNNKPAASQNIAIGDIGTSFFTTDAAGSVLYILGAANTDTDEFDTHVVAHEIGHYLLNAISRDDNIGGQHGGGDKLDMRVAFSEGWGNGWSGVALGSPVYIDSYGNNQAQSFSIDLSASPSGTNRGWYSEASAEYLVWTATQNFGFGPVYAALTSMRASPAFSSLYSFAAALKAATPANTAAITALWATQNIVATDAFGTGETNNGGNAANLPVYKTHAAAIGSPQNYCAHSDLDPGGDGNKLGEYVFVRFTASGTHTLTLAKTTTTSTVTPTDPDFGLVLSNGGSDYAGSGAPDLETLAGVVLPVGTHAVAVGDFNLSPNKQTCLDFKVN